MAENEHFDDGKGPNQDTTPPSDPKPGSQSEMLRSWMRVLPKDYWQDSTLGKFETFGDALDALTRRPEPKTVPDSYGEKEGIEKAYRSAGLTKAEADAISAAYKAEMPKRKSLQEAFGDRLTETMGLYDKGIGSFADDMKDRIAESGLDKDPVFVEVMSRVGKETGGDVFRKPDPKDKPKDPATRMVEQAYGD